MTSPAKLTATVIWLAIFSGLFVVLFYLGDGLGTLLVEFEIRSVPLLLVGLVSLAVSAWGRMALSRAKSDEQFQQLLIICLAVCEGPAFVGLLLFPDPCVTERAFAFLCAVVGVAMLCPLTITRQGQGT